MTAPHPTEGELAILRVLWSRKAPMTVREVHEVLSRDKDTAYTTVLKMLTIMAEKGLLVRDESERSHTYLPVHAEPVVQASLLKDLMRRAFSGSALTLVQRAIDDDIASAEELDAMSKLIAQAKAKRKR
ncbi:BlaI/MecI/CopY family transcriptional regulator [Cognatilysobacter bugurensis]|uniref:Transcriptional regulator n=1 Tax=Cognatilysobacter bugurensis TaxID=543356 RepID=A0A918SYJ0_9GAMM|nr:BlaI/MecI/CopY family transcriptional regulator [Lysobacter bugurensis]GHA78720.1 transcriptional regulator [Lysobacter bugurensis]